MSRYRRRQVRAWRIKTPRTPTRLAVGLGAEGAPSRRGSRFAPEEFGSPASFVRRRIRRSTEQRHQRAVIIGTQSPAPRQESRALAVVQISRRRSCESHDSDRRSQLGEPRENLRNSFCNIILRRIRSTDGTGVALVDRTCGPVEGLKFLSTSGVRRLRLVRSREESAMSQTGRSKRILIVDDEPNVRLVFRTALESVGYTGGRGGRRGRRPSNGSRGRRPTSFCSISRCRGRSEWRCSNASASRATTCRW